MIEHKKRRTKIVVTLGPSTDDVAVLEQVIDAGANVFRANFSHGTADEHRQRIRAVRELSQKKGIDVAVFADLQGPKIRIARFKTGKVMLSAGDTFILDATLHEDAGTEKGVGLDYKQLPHDLSVEDTLLLDDGRLVLTVSAIKGEQIICTVKVGGQLSNNKGINRLGGGLSAKALTPKDHEDLNTAIALGVDYIAISFPRCAEDMRQAKALIQAAQGTAGVIAKIERKEALEHIESIIEASDAVMVARGDLGVEIGDGELPGAQKHIIHMARALNKPVITATQMMESMITNSIPTRAEVFDVANAVLDGTDAVMLSAETATGDDPVQVVLAVDRICLAAEKQPRARISKHRVECQFKQIDEAIAMSAMYAANHLDIEAIICLTESGSTPLWMSRISSAIPIYGLSRHIQTRQKIALYRGVYPIEFDPSAYPHSSVLNQQAAEALVSRDLAAKGNLVIITKGDLIGVHGSTNAMKIFTIGQSDQEAS